MGGGPGWFVCVGARPWLPGASTWACGLAIARDGTSIALVDPDHVFARIDVATAKKIASSTLPHGTATYRAILGATDEPVLTRRETVTEAGDPAEYVDPWDWSGTPHGSLRVERGLDSGRAFDGRLLVANRWQRISV